LGLISECREKFVLNRFIHVSSPIRTVDDVQIPLVMFLGAFKLKQADHTGLIPTLIELLDSPHQNVVDKTIFSLNILVDGKPAMAQYYLIRGVLPALLRLMNKPELSAESLQTCGNILGMMCMFRIFPPETAVESMAPALTAYSSHSDADPEVSRP